MLRDEAELTNCNFQREGQMNKLPVIMTPERIKQKLTENRI